MQDKNSSTRIAALRLGHWCRTWYAKMFEASDEFIERILPPDLRPAVVELSPYFQQSFGNVTRLDYGTGHETSFIAFLYCLAALSEPSIREQRLSIRAVKVDGGSLSMPIVVHQKHLCCLS